MKETRIGIVALDLYDLVSLTHNINFSVARESLKTLLTENKLVDERCRKRLIRLIPAFKFHSFQLK